MLNTALLKTYYHLDYWDIPPGYLCPPIPGRADYVHYMADLLASCNDGKIPLAKNVRCLDIGTGANCIYPIIGRQEYGWSFIGTDIDPVAIASANKIIASNTDLKTAIECRLQPDPADIFYGVVQAQEKMDLVFCNPPFYTSPEDARGENLRKVSHLNPKEGSVPAHNFGGRNNELWCDGGEEKFVRSMVKQSRQFMKSCFWFSSLVAKKDHLKSIYKELQKINPVAVKTIEMGQGHKTSRVVTWTFLSRQEQNIWKQERWQE